MFSYTKRAFKGDDEDDDDSDDNDVVFSTRKSKNSSAAKVPRTSSSGRATASKSSSRAVIDVSLSDDEAENDDDVEIIATVAERAQQDVKQLVATKTKKVEDEVEQNWTAVSESQTAKSAEALLQRIEQTKNTFIEKSSTPSTSRVAQPAVVSRVRIPVVKERSGIEKASAISGIDEKASDFLFQKYYQTDQPSASSSSSSSAGKSEIEIVSEAKKALTMGAGRMKIRTRLTGGFECWIVFPREYPFSKVTSAL
jgi:hypothetical protein